MEEFLDVLLEQGKILFQAPPSPAIASPQVNRLLRHAFECDLLSLASTPLNLNLDLAFAAAEYVRQTAWLLVNRDEQVPQAVQRLVSLPTAASPDDIASADLLLRYLPKLYLHSVAISPEDVLSQHLKQTLRHWPLSGVLADLPEAPQAPLHFFGHIGLQLRYAERLALRPRSGWGPTDSGSLEAVTMVFELKPLSLQQLKVIPLPGSEATTEMNHE